MTQSEAASATPPPQRRKRRTTEEIVERILAAAGEEFELYGYAGATTAKIAKKAHVAEALIFSNFGSKAKLFHDSIFKPLSRHLVEFCRDHLPDLGAKGITREDLRCQYINELQSFIRRHHRKLISLLFVQMYGDGSGGLNDVGGIQEYFEQAFAIEMQNFDKVKRIDPRVIARLSFAAIFSGIILKDWLFPEGMVADDEMQDALTAFVIDGLNANARKYAGAIQPCK